MKKIQNQEMNLVTLKHVVSRASKDENFQNSLLKAPKATSKNSALKLSDADGKKLNTLVVKTRRVKNKHMADLIKYSKQLGLEPPSPPPWGLPK